jgi:hypothetical protein
MAALADRVKESTATTGQGTVTLAGAAVGFRSFTAAFGNGVAVYYVIAGGAEWEVGIGTTGAGTLSRDTVIGSSAGGTTKVTFSAGTKDVFCSVPASRLVLTDNLASANTANAVVQRDGSGNFAAGTITAALTGNASTATALQTARNINGVSFNGTADITVTAAAGTLTGTTLASNVVSSSLTSVGTLANLTVTNPITGSVTGSSGSTTGNAATATALQTARAINGVNFDGTAAITVTAAAGTLTGATLAAGVTASSLTSVGTLGSLTVTNPITGSVTGSSGSTTGNAATATALQTARNINGVSFNGTADITVTAAAGTLSGNTLASGVTASSLTSVGTLTSLAVSGTLITPATITSSGASTSVSINNTNANAWGSNLAIATGGTAAGYFGTIGSLLGTTTQDLAVYATSGNGFRVYTNGNNERIHVDAPGNLGLGVTPSAWSSSYTAMQIRSLSLFGSTSNSEASIGGNVFVNTSGQYAYRSPTLASVYQQVNGTHAWFTAPSGANAGDPITFTQAMTLDASGNLGVGTASPKANAGYATLTLNNATNGGVVEFAQNNTTVGQLYIDGTSAVLRSVANIPLAFGTNNTERARITAGGKFGVGAYGTIVYQLEVLETSGADRDILIAGVSGATNGLTVKWNHASSKTYVSIANIPTSSAGLPAGTLYSDGGTIKIA